MYVCVWIVFCTFSNSHTHTADRNKSCVDARHSGRTRAVLKRGSCHHCTVYHVMHVLAIYMYGYVCAHSLRVQLLDIVQFNIAFINEFMHNIYISHTFIQHTHTHTSMRKLVTAPWTFFIFFYFLCFPVRLSYRFVMVECDFRVYII